MKKKLIIITTFVICAVCISAFISINGNKTISGRSNNQPSYADWKDHYNTDKEVIKNSDLIIRGKVVNSYAEKRADMIFTKQVVEIKKVLKGDLTESQTIEILQTGGELGDIKTPAFEDAPLLDKNGSYIFMLKKSNEGHYLIMGGFQGMGKIEGDLLSFSKDSKDTFKNFHKKNITDVENAIQELVK